MKRLIFGSNPPQPGLNPRGGVRQRGAVWAFGSTPPLKVRGGWVGLCFASALLFFCSTGLSSAFNLPDTGQTKCYQSVSPYTEIPCAGTGQDGAYNINPMSFTNNSNGTVTDNNTGLMWQKCSVGQNNDSTCSGTAVTYNWYQTSGTYDATYNPTSQDVCGELTRGGYTDWRLPLRKELITIVDYSIPFPGPTINASYFPNTHTLTPYWTVNDGFYSYLAQSVRFITGGMAYDHYKHEDGPVVRCVRGEWAPTLFTDNGDGTVTDSKTGLMWQQGETVYMTWGSALSFCNNLSLAEKTDWRLPSIKELESLTDDTRVRPAIDMAFFPDTHLAIGYWSSTTIAESFDLYDIAWEVGFDLGKTQPGRKRDGNISPYLTVVRCVRGGRTLFDLVTYYYLSILNRAPEPGGAEGWTGEIERIDALGIDLKEGFIALGKLFFNSDEYLSMNTTDSEYITDLYETFLGRTPTQEEIDGWAAELAGGLTRNLLLNYFIFSAEFMQYMTDYFGDTSVRPEYNLLNDLYRSLLSRLPDDGGFNYWLGEMQTAQCNGDPQAIRDLTSQIALLFLNSEEYAARNTSNSEFIEDLYNGILRRGAELSGYLFWLGELNGGVYTRAEMLQLFIDSAEFQTRVQQVIDAGCEA